MKKWILVLLAVVLLIPAGALGQHSSKAAEATPAGSNFSKAVPKAVTLTGQISLDGKTLVSEENDIWTVSNAKISFSSLTSVFPSRLIWPVSVTAFGTAFEKFDPAGFGGLRGMLPQGSGGNQQDHCEKNQDPFLHGAPPSVKMDALFEAILGLWFSGSNGKIRCKTSEILLRRFAVSRLLQPKP